MFDFDKVIDRSSTYSFKWERYKGRDIIPAWVADTEFECPPAIIDGLTQRSQHGIFGYTLPNQYQPAIDAVQRWCKKQYDWSVESEWIVWTPGVVPAFNMAINAFTKTGDAVIVQSPNYPPLLAAPLINARRRYTVDTILIDGKWTLDFDQLEMLAAKPESKLFILCNPMNPNGAVLSAEQLNRIADICVRHGVMVCSDEIHCDLILDGSRHLPIGSIPSLTNNSVTLMAASKTFNVAGLGTSFAIIPDTTIRQRFVRAGNGIVPWVNVMGLVATELAFTLCDDWHQAELDYLRGNRDFLARSINQIHGLNCVAPQATFLLWVNASQLGVDDTQAWAEAKGIGPSPGRDFGQPECFRINYGCSRSMLERLVKRLAD